MEVAYNPKELQEALDVLSLKTPKIIAGGTDVMLSDNNYEEVMFIGGITAIKKIRSEESILSIGAGVTMTDLLKNKETEFLKDIIESIASPGVRNWGTVGGNICNASPIGDLLPVIYVLDGRVVVRKKDSVRKVAIEDFVLDRKKVDLRDGELVEGIEVLKPSMNCEKMWFKVAGREANALSKVSLFVLLKYKGKTLEEFRLAIGGLAPTVIRDREIEEKIIEAFNEKKSDEELKVFFKEYKKRFYSVDDQRSNSRYKFKVAEKIFGEIMEVLKKS